MKHTILPGDSQSARPTVRSRPPAHPVQPEAGHIHCEREEQMTEAKQTHTPGPWTADYDPDHGQPWGIKGADGYYLASIHSDGPKSIQEHNARLIAAAPDLLEACEGLMPLVDRAFDFLLRNSHPEERDGHADGLESIISEARAAIARAKMGAVVTALVCEVCGVDISAHPQRQWRCTNQRCGQCHNRYCTSSGNTEPGHGRGDIATPYSPEAIRARNRETVALAMQGRVRVCGVCRKPLRNPHYCVSCGEAVCLGCGEGHQCLASDKRDRERQAEAAIDRREAEKQAIGEARLRGTR